MIVFILLALVCLGLIGFACACLSDQSALALDRALLGPALPGLVELWPVLILALLAPAFVLIGVEVQARARASPARLQRFLF